MFGHVIRVNPSARVVGFGEPQTPLVLIAGRNDAAVDVVECAELHLNVGAFEQSEFRTQCAYRSRICLNTAAFVPAASGELEISVPGGVGVMPSSTSGPSSTMPMSFPWQSALNCSSRA